MQWKVLQNGKKIGFPDSMSNDQILQALNKRFAPQFARAENLAPEDFVPPTAEVSDARPPTPPKIDAGEAAVMGFAEEGTLGLESEIVAAYGSLKEAANKGSFDKISEQYDRLRNLEQQRLEQAKEQQPGAYYTGATVGAVATPLKVLKGAKLGAEALKRTVGMGMVEGFGKSEAETPAELAVDVGTGGVIWGLGGKLTDYAMKYAGIAGDRLIVNSVDKLIKGNVSGNKLLTKVKWRAAYSKQNSDDYIHILKKSIRAEKSPKQKKQLEKLLVSIEEKINVDKSIQTLKMLEDKIVNIADGKTRNIIKTAFNDSKEKSIGFLNDPVAAFNNLSGADKIVVAGVVATQNIAVAIPTLTTKGIKKAGALMKMPTKAIVAQFPKKLRAATEKYTALSLFKMGSILAKIGDKKGYQKIPDYMKPVFDDLGKSSENGRNFIKAFGLAGAGVLHSELLKNKKYRENVRAALDYYGWDVTLMGNPKGNKNGK